MFIYHAYSGARLVSFLRRQKTSCISMFRSLYEFTIYWSLRINKNQYPLAVEYCDGL
jgi:hypothetical protein